MKFSYQPKETASKLELLLGCLTNPGRFSILLLGSRGVGKSHWVHEIVKTKKSNDCFNGIVEIHASILNFYDLKSLNEVLNSTDGKVLIIKDVECLCHEKQDLLFEFLSTTDGCFGLNEKNISCRIVFTSTLKIESLRDNEHYLKHKFFDRIAQLVVQLPSFQDGNRSISRDFYATWKKMKFPEDMYPKLILDWLNDKSGEFYGNFRDLDKIAINWRNFQLMNWNDEEILKQVQNDFYGYYKFPENNLESKNYFKIDDDADYYKDLLPNFRNHIKLRALEIYNNNLKKAPEKKPFGVPYRTMERW
ncbi:MAG: hypothetical protein RL264_583 [Bacteroidota bacterium]|jgi:hypothetical protein